MILTDTHCHLDFRNYEKDRGEVLNRAWETGLERILVPGIDLPTSQAAIELADQHPNIFAAVGVHPNSAKLWDETTLAFLEEMAAHSKVVAIGEIGLDYYRDRSLPALQKQVLKHQLDLAERCKLPVVIHTRNASSTDRRCMIETLQILSEFSVQGVLHSFSGNLEEARLTIEQSFFLGITGPITFKSAQEIREVVSHIPLEHLLIETDGPFLTPHPFRGKRNEPSYVKFVAEKISEVKDQPCEVVARKTTMNAQRLFQWSN
jgi:TatD DNase family protein